MNTPRTCIILCGALAMQVAVGSDTLPNTVLDILNSSKIANRDKASELNKRGVWFGGHTYDAGYFGQWKAWVLFKNSSPYPVTVKIEGAIPAYDFDAQPKDIPAGKTLLNGIGLWHITDVIFTTDAKDSNGNAIVPVVARRNLAIPLMDLVYARIDAKKDETTGLTKLVLSDTRGL